MESSQTGSTRHVLQADLHAVHVRERVPLLERCILLVQDRLEGLRQVLGVPAEEAVEGNLLERGAGLGKGVARGGEGRGDLHCCLRVRVALPGVGCGVVVCDLALGFAFSAAAGQPWGPSSSCDRPRIENAIAPPLPRMNEFRRCPTCPFLPFFTFPAV